MKNIIHLVLVLCAFVLSAPVLAGINAEEPTMANFDQALAFVYRNEGGDSDHAADAGLATRYGISLRFLQLANIDVDRDGHVNEADIRALTRAEAEAVYRKHFWEHYRLQELDSDRVATKALDLFVNMRGQVAARCFQSAFNIMKARPILQVDGVLGSQTIATLNSVDDDAVELYVTHVKIEQAEVYRAIVRKDPTQRVFEVGWLRRAAFG